MPKEMVRNEEKEEDWAGFAFVCEAKDMAGIVAKK